MLDFLRRFMNIFTSLVIIDKIFPEKSENEAEYIYIFFNLRVMCMFLCEHLLILKRI